MSTREERLYQIEMMLGELQELCQHYKDLKTDHFLLEHDNYAIKHSTNVPKLILTQDYFDGRKIYPTTNCILSEKEV